MLDHCVYQSLVLLHGGSISEAVLLSFASNLLPSRPGTVGMTKKYNIRQST